MGKTKTFAEYEASIRIMYPEVQLLKAYCEANPEDLATATELEKKKSTLRWYRNRWAERIPVTVYVDGREQLENKAEELRYDTKPTPQYHKKKWPYYSVGDYIAYIEGVGWYPVCRERKSLNDLYGTLMDENNRKNLYEEFERFKVDTRFTIFRFDLECTEEEFFDYYPQKQKTCKFCEVNRLKMDSGDYFCPRMYRMFLSKDIDPEFRCHEGFVERQRDAVEIQRLKSLKTTILRQCHEMGMQIVWRGSREAACDAYRPGVEEWLKLNYISLLRLDEMPEKDHALLLRKIAYHEAELQAARASLLRYEVTVEEVKV